MPDLPIDTNDIYKQFGVSPNDYTYDPSSNTIKRKELALPTELPTFDAMGTPMPINGNSDYTGINPAVGKLFGVGGNERYQTWPERLIRSGSTIAGDVASGEVPITDENGHTSQAVIERAQDMAGLAGMSSIPLAGKGALGAIGGKFYSTLENTIAGSKVSKGTPEQWASYLKNQPGVKPEELEFSLQGLGDGVVTKEQLAAHIADNGIKLGEVEKGNLKQLPEGYQIKKDTTNNSYYVETPDGQTNMAAWRTPEAAVDSMLRNLNRDNGAKYSSYQLPGGENYRELLMTSPDKAPINRKLKWEDLTKEEQAKVKEVHDESSLDLDPKDRIPNVKNYYETVIAPTAELQNSYAKLDHYRSSHWDEPNVLAHIRMNDREVPGVGKTLHVEEIQSDWHQAGRKGGYKGQDITTEDQAIRDRIKNNKATTEDYLAWENGVGNKFAKDTDSNRVPNAPFKKTWDELALKRVLSEAVNKGYDAVSWTPGEAQAARYDLSKSISDLTYDPRTRMLKATDKSGKNNVLNQKVEPEKLGDFVGKDVAEKLLKTEYDMSNPYSTHTLNNQDLKVGGEGMKAFYDKMLVDKANALVKKMGGKVEYSTDVVYPKLSNKIGEKPEETRVPIIKITPQMREQIKEKGFPLYSSGVPTFTPVDHDPHKMTPVEYNPFTNPRAS